MKEYKDKFPPNDAVLAKIMPQAKYGILYFKIIQTRE